MGNKEYIFEDEFTLGPSYIYRDGKFLNLITNHCNSHYIFESYNCCHGKKGRRVFTNKFGIIRLNDGEFIDKEIEIDLPKSDITPEQEESILKFIDCIIAKGKSFVIVGIDAIGSRGVATYPDSLFFKKYEFKDGYTSFDILEDIREYYKKRQI